MTTIHAPRPLDIPAATARPARRGAPSAPDDGRGADRPTDTDLASPGASALTAGLSLVAVLAVCAGAAVLAGLAFRAALAFFAG